MEEENQIYVAVDNSANDRVYPQKADFTFYGGLYRDVNLICVPFAELSTATYIWFSSSITSVMATRNVE